MRLVVAVGGNALLRRGEPPDAAVQQHHVRTAARSLAPLTVEHELVLVHGNGPQVGLLAEESYGGYDYVVINGLVRTNWLRTVAWTLRLAVLVAVVL